MTLIIYKPRGAGKTTDIIKEAHERNMYILVGNRTQAEYKFNQAKDMGMLIPYPITVSEWKAGNVASKVKRQGILVDEGQRILEELLETKVHVMSVTKNEVVDNEIKLYDTQDNLYCTFNKEVDDNE